MYQNIVVLTGAGISAESGIKTFRDNNGLWENHRIEEVATPEAFERNPELVHRFYNLRRQQLLSEAQPNPAHFALAKLEQALGDNLLIVTQNVDNLHEKAGNERIYHMHGELLKGMCCRTRERFAVEGDMTIDSRCNCCDDPQPVRPDIVWFGEMPYYMPEISEAIRNADLFVSIGTSGNVYPAAGFVSEANHYGVYTLELNLEPSKNNTAFYETRYGPASELIPEWVDEVIAELNS